MERSRHLRTLRRACVLLGVAALAIPAPARAEPPAADRALATDLFNQARTLLADGKSSEACPKFEESQRLDPGVGTLLNLANCHELEGKTATAWSEFNEALAVAERERQPDCVMFAESHIAALAQRLSRLVVVVPDGLDTADLEVTRDGSTIPRIALGTAIPIDPGTHRIEVRARGFAPWSTQVEIADAARIELAIGPLLALPEPSITPAPLAPVAPPIPGPAPRDEPRSPTRTAGMIAAGGGLFALGVGAVAGVLAITKSARSETLCAPRCNDEGYALNQEAKTAADVSTVSLIVGAAALGVGVVLFLTSRPASRGPSPSAATWVSTPALRFW